MSPVDRPVAPASRAASTSATIAASSSGVGGRASVPMTAARTVPWPTRQATFGPSCCSPTASRYSPNVSHRATSWLGRSDSSTISRPRGVIGASVSPQFPDSCGGIALVQVAGQRPVDEQRAVGMAVRVDEPGSHDPAAGVEHGRDLAVIDRGQVADGDDPVAEHSHVRPHARPPGAVDHGPATEQQVERGHVPMVTRSCRHQSGVPDRAVASGRLRLPWGYSSAGRASAWHAGGPGFESP